MFLHPRVKTFRLAPLPHTGRNVVAGAQLSDTVLANRCGSRLFAVASKALGGLDQL